MEVDEEHVKTLMSMGFPSESEIRRALRHAKSDLGEAVGILTNDHPVTSFETIDDDVEMKDIHSRSAQTQGPVEFGPQLPPSYNEVIQEKHEEVVADATCNPEDSDAFPVTNLFELEGRVFADHWSIPYKKEESLGKCLIAAARMAEAGAAESDEYCKRFIDRCMPEAFSKLMTSPAVHRWNTEIQEGILNMLELLVDLVVARLQHLPVPFSLLETLTMAFNPNTEFHFKNCSRRDRHYWDDKFDTCQLYAISPSNGYKEPYGWLTHLLNWFAHKEGFNHLRRILEEEELDAPSIAALLRPFGICAEFLNTEVLPNILYLGIEKAIKFVQNLEEKDFKEKKVGTVSDMLASMKLLCIHMWAHSVDGVDELRLEIALRMLKSPNFNAKMNSLKEVTKLIEDSTGNKMPKTAMHSQKILEWLVQNQILSIALEGNIDQAQYCDKIKGIVDFLGAELSLDELTTIWRMQIGQTNNVIDNIHSIIAAAAVKFDSQQLEHLFLLIQKKWQEDHHEKMREKLLSLIGKIGRDARIPKTTTRVLELLWDLAHLPALSTHLTEQALGEHLTILSDSYSIKEQVKRQYVMKCVEDIKKGACVLPALKQLLQLSKNILKQSIHKTDKGILHELNKNHDVIKLVTMSLIKCHKQAAGTCGDGQLEAGTIVDGRYPHSEYVTMHLNFLQYVLQEGVLYLPWNRARDIWSTLIGSPEACDWDRETAYDWFGNRLLDLEMETQSQLFQKELLKLDTAKITEKGFTCMKRFFESVNMYEHKLKGNGNYNIVEKCELSGLDFLWEDAVSLHKKFISECSNRLEAAMIGIVGTAVARAVSTATKILTAVVVPEVANVPLPSRSRRLQNIERLLWIAEAYILTVEEAHNTARTILPHGASFQGHQINLLITCESAKKEFMLVCHSNESLRSVRQKISNHLQQTQDHIEIVAHEKMLGSAKDQKLLHQLDFEDNQMIQVRLVTTTTASLQSAQVKEATMTPTSKQNFDLEQEKMLPGVVMAIGGQVFDMLYQLADQDEARITARVRKLLMLIPTDPTISDALDSISQKSVKNSPSNDDVSPKTSPRKSHNTPALSPRQPPKEVLKSLFDSSATDMSAFRVLYNLEVLSSKLMSTSQDMGTKLSAQCFCEDFLNSGGLSMVVNVLQPESLPTETNYQIRQGCYSICLQLARFLLCGQDVTGEPVTMVTAQDDIKGAGFVEDTPVAGSSLTTTLSVDTCTTAGSHAVQTMGVPDFSETVSCFMRVAWAAAAGRLHLLSSSQPIRESNCSYGCGRRSRQSSTGSTASTGSESDSGSLHAGVCVQQSAIPTKDSIIAKEAIEILVTCLQLRSELLAAFYSLPCVSDFIIDILVGCTQTDIRNAAHDNFYLLSQTEISHTDSNNQQTPHQFILQVLLKAYLPFWVTSSSTRGTSQKLLMQCSQYFDLRCKLLNKLSKADLTKFQIDVMPMLEDELAWLSNFVPSDNADLRETDNCLLAGHLKLIKTLFTCEGVDKEQFSQTLVHDLLHDFLFPASKLMMDSMNQSTPDSALADVNPKCSSSEPRVAAHQLLTELANDNLVILTDICKQLIQMHHLPHTDSANEWEYLPPVDGRASCGFVGLRNGGATCYMNSVIQQLYMAPGIPEAILGIDEDNIEEDSVFFQIQQVFGHLMESKLQYHEPEKFWKVFKLWGQTVNIREQQDAFDFFQALIDQCDEHMKKTGKDEIFKKKFQGIFSDQKICKDCPHRYEREEAFFALNLTVKNATLQDSLDQFVKDELLEGENAYYCEKCGEKRNTIKRMCIKILPPLLCIQLKRFGYDWEANRALKFDDYLKFPWLLDMEPYTAEGMARREAESASEASTDSDDQNGNSENRAPELTISHNTGSSQINYELTGIVVHSGQANAGHYYSFIKDRRGTVWTNQQKGKWFKFNDTIVEEFEMNDGNLEAECFGGFYKAKVYDQSNSYPEERQRYWNGYMLFYEKVEGPKTPAPAKKSKLVARKNIMEGKNPLHSDTLSQLTELVHKGERKGIFMDQMPSSIHNIIQAENLTFVKNRDVYNDDYFKFVKQLAAANSSHEKSSCYQELSVQSLQLGIKFLFNTYFRTKKKTKRDLDEWIEVIEVILQRSKKACIWLVEYFSGEEGAAYLKPFLLECPNKDVRLTMSKILERMMSSYFAHGGVPIQKAFDEILGHLLHMLNKDVVDNCKNCVQYFLVLKSYVQMGTKACAHMFGRNAFQKLVTFLLGQGPENSDQESGTRRWSSIQSRDFGYLHTTIAMLILNCDVSFSWTEEPGDYSRKPKTVVPQKVLKMSEEMQSYVFGSESSRYLREVVHSIREVGGGQSAVCDVLSYCSFCNANFTITVLKYLMLQYMNAPSSELKPIFSILTELLTLEDPLQLKRIRLVIDGYRDDKATQYEGLLSVIRLNHSSDSRRSYCGPLTGSKRRCLSTIGIPATANTTLSNEDSNRKSFQRTISAQDTLAEATALLTELEAQESGQEMEITSQSNDEMDQTQVGTSSPTPADAPMSSENEEKPQKTSRES
ncbi:hypothetical protein ScPMuIL_005907 [Solemya velum]